MRDAIAVQRRRRLLVLQHGRNTGVAADEITLPENGAAETQAAIKQLLHESGTRAGTQLRVELAGGGATTVELNCPFILIGRDSDCDVRFEHPAILPRHLYLQWIDGRLFCCSLGTPGTHFPPVATWIDQTPVAVGPLQLSLMESDPMPALRSDGPKAISDPLAKSPDLAHDVPQVLLSFEGVEQSDNDWPVDRPLTLIGSGAHCKLRLDHVGIPTVLAGLFRTPTSLWLINLAGENLLRVNDRPVSLQSLDFGDLLEMGPFRAEVSAAAIRLKTVRPALEQAATIRRATVGELSERHRQRLGILTRSLATVQLYLDDEHLNSVPELKSTLQSYIQQAQRHHREMQEALDELSGLT